MSDYEIKMNEVNQIITQDGLKKWLRNQNRKQEKKNNKDKDAKEKNKDKDKNRERDSFEKIFIDKINFDKVRELIKENEEYE